MREDHARFAAPIEYEGLAKAYPLSRFLDVADADPMRALRDVFGHDDFRIGQAEVIDSVLAGRPTLAVMPTGAGKSLCYQLPAVMLDGLTVVVSPLIALIRNQVDALQEKGIAAASLTSADPSDVKRTVRRQLDNGELSLLYVAPERFRSSSFMDQLKRRGVELFVIDEAHCISQWGHDFRPDYAKLGWVASELAPQRIVGLTATATPHVREDIVNHLGLKEVDVFVTGFDRPNLELSVLPSRKGKAKVEATESALRKWLRYGGSGIVYVATRKKAEDVAAALVQNGLSAAPYHAGMDLGIRNEIQRDFHDNTIQIVVATTAFGMGIDKPDVRVVVHFQIPSSPEGYYQEVGRAGRDGKPAGGVLIYDSGDLGHVYHRFEASCPSYDTVRTAFDVLRHEAGRLRLDFEGWVEELEGRVGISARSALVALERSGDVSFDGGHTMVQRPDLQVDRAYLETRERIERARVDAMVGYVKRAPCRRRYLVDYFGDERRPDQCGVCDRCLAPAAVALEGDDLKHAQMALSCIARMQGRFGKGRVAEVLLGSQSQPVKSAGLDRLSTYGLLSDWSRNRVMDLIDALIRADLARVLGTDYPKVQLTPLGAETLKERRPIHLDTLPPTRTARKKKEKSPVHPVDNALFEALRAWRTTQAQSESVPSYIIASDKLLTALCQARPENLNALAGVAGIGPVKLERYGTALLEILEQHANDHAAQPASTS